MPCGDIESISATKGLTASNVPCVTLLFHGGAAF